MLSIRKLFPKKHVVKFKELYLKLKSGRFQHLDPLQLNYLKQNKIFLLLDGRIHITTSRNLEDIKYQAYVTNEEDAKRKGWDFHEKNPTCDSVWGEFILDPILRKFFLSKLRYDLPPVLKYGELFGG